jgi:uncharacterized repeat protein (TIGR03803 family)
MRTKILTLAFLLITISTARGATQKVLYTFTGGVDGGKPYAGVIFDKAGNLYGVTEKGGTYGHGTVFQLTPSGTGWTETVLYSFTGGSDGDDPVGGLIIDDAGNLYGTTIMGGNGTDCGTIFKLAPTGGSWTLTTLHMFAGGTDGCAPGASLRIFNLWLDGTTVAGGRSDQGTMFSISTNGGTPYIHAFSRNNGNQPWGSVNEWGYVTTYFGGLKRGGTISEPWCCGTGIRVVKTFSDTNKAGYGPIGDLLTGHMDGEPRMWGTVYSGGAGRRGSVYQLRPGAYYEVWILNVLHAFSGPDGDGPGAGVIMDAAGNLYGTTMWGGADPGYAGTVYKLTPAAKGKWTHTLLYSFSGGIDGGEVTSGVVMDSAVNLYGTAVSGGAFDQGVVYEIQNP